MNKSKIVMSLFVIGTMTMASCTSALAYTKEETVYTKLNPDGEETITVVSEHLKNDDNEQIMKDLTSLSHVMNMNGDEKFTQKGENINWESQGNDIYYQGKTEKQLPITTKITYKLNSRECQEQHSPCSSWVYSKEEGTVQYMYINKCYTAHN